MVITENLRILNDECRVKAIRNYQGGTTTELKETIMEDCGEVKTKEIPTCTTASADEYLRIPNEDWRVTPEYTAITGSEQRLPS